LSEKRSTNEQTANPPWDVVGPNCDSEVWTILRQLYSSADTCRNVSRNKPPLASCHNLLPVQGSDTQSYRNVLKNPSIRIDARGVGAEFRAAPVTDAKGVKSVIEKVREKYGAEDMKKYYSGFDVAVTVEVG